MNNSKIVPRSRKERGTFILVSFPQPFSQLKNYLSLHQVYDFHLASELVSIAWFCTRILSHQRHGRHCKSTSGLIAPYPKTFSKKYEAAGIQMRAAIFTQCDRVFAIPMSPSTRSGHVRCSAKVLSKTCFLCHVHCVRSTEFR